MTPPLPPAPPPSKEPKNLLEREVAERLRMSVRTVQKLRRKGDLVGFKAAGRRLYRRSQVEAFEKRQEEAEPHEPEEKRA